MVTEMKRQGGSGLSADEKEIASLSKTADEQIAAAIKARSSSFTTLATAAATCMILMIVHGRSEKFNKLYVGLLDNKATIIDADALRQKFALRVNDKFAVDGIFDPDAKKWVKRPSQMIQYKATPEVKGEHFSFRKAKDADTEMQGKIAAYRDKVKAAGVDGLAAINWDSRERVVRAADVYTLDSFETELTRLLVKAAKQAKPNEADTEETSFVHKSHINAVMKAVGLKGNNRKAINEVLQLVGTASAPKSEGETETPAGTEGKPEEKPVDKAA